MAYAYEPGFFVNTERICVIKICFAKKRHTSVLCLSPNQPLFGWKMWYRQIYADWDVCAHAVPL